MTKGQRLHREFDRQNEELARNRFLDTLLRDFSTREKTLQIIEFQTALYADNPNRRSGTPNRVHFSAVAAHSVELALRRGITDQKQLGDIFDLGYLHDTPEDHPESIDRCHEFLGNVPYSINALDRLTKFKNEKAFDNANRLLSGPAAPGIYMPEVLIVKIEDARFNLDPDENKDKLMVEGRLGSLWHKMVMVECFEAVLDGRFNPTQGIEGFLVSNLGRHLITEDNVARIREGFEVVPPILEQEKIRKIGRARTRRRQAPVCEHCGVET